MHLEEKDTSAFNGVESTVYEKYTAQQLEIDWVPRHESLSLLKLSQSEDGDDSMLIQNKLNTIIKRLDTVVTDLEEVQSKIQKRDNKAADMAKAAEIERNKAERSNIDQSNLA